MLDPSYDGSVSKTKRSFCRFFASQVVVRGTLIEFRRSFVQFMSPIRSPSIVSLHDSFIVCQSFDVTLQSGANLAFLLIAHTACIEEFGNEILSHAFLHQFSLLVILEVI